MDKGQTMRFSSAERQVIRDLFKSEEVLYQVRNIFYGFPYEEFRLSEEGLKIVKKIFIPELDPDVPLGQQADIFHLKLNIIEAPIPEVAMLQVKARDLATKYLKERFEVLWSRNESNATMSLQGLKEVSEIDDTQRFIRLSAYMFLTSYIDSMVMQLKQLANQEEMTEEEMKKRAKLNSSK